MLILSNWYNSKNLHSSTSGTLIQATDKTSVAHAIWGFATDHSTNWKQLTAGFTKSIVPTLNQWLKTTIFNGV